MDTASDPVEQAMVDLMAPTLSPAEARLWLLTSQPGLGNNLPTTLIRIGRADQVAAEARRVAHNLTSEGHGR